MKLKTYCFYFQSNFKRVFFFITASIILAQSTTSMHQSSIQMVSLPLSSPVSPKQSTVSNVISPPSKTYPLLSKQNANSLWWPSWQGASLLLHDISYPSSLSLPVFVEFSSKNFHPPLGLISDITSSKRLFLPCVSCYGWPSPCSFYLNKLNLRVAFYLHKSCNAPISLLLTSYITMVYVSQLINQNWWITTDEALYTLGGLHYLLDALFFPGILSRIPHDI